MSFELKSASDIVAKYICLVCIFSGLLRFEHVRSIVLLHVDINEIVSWNHFISTINRQAKITATVA